jgi:hypothetical protein
MLFAGIGGQNGGFPDVPARFPDNLERFLDDLGRLLGGLERFLEHLERLLDGPERFLEHLERLLDGPERLMERLGRFPDGREMAGLRRESLEWCRGKAGFWGQNALDCDTTSGAIWRNSGNYTQNAFPNINIVVRDIGKLLPSVGIICPFQG